MVAAALSLAANAQGPLAPSFIRVSAAPGLVTFRLRPNGPANGSSPVTLVTSWRLQQAVQVSVYAYFSNPPAALSSSGGKIPSSSVFGTDASGRLLSFTGTGPFSRGGSLTVFQERVLGRNRRRTRTDSMSLQINTTGLKLGPGNYTGLLIIQAHVF